MKSKLLTAGISLLIAFALWMYVITVISPGSENTYNNVPVTLQGEGLLKERGLIITSSTPVVSLRLAGNRTDLNNLNSSNISVVVNVSQIYNAGEILLNYNVYFPGNIPTNAISLQNHNPDQVTLRVENYVSKQVGVNVEYTGTLPAGLMYDKENAELNSSQIRVAGPQSVVDQITQAKIEVNLDGRTESFSDQFEYTLCNLAGEPVDAKLIETDVEAVNLTLKIQRVKEIKLVVNVIEGGGATTATSKITILPETIRISGSETLLDGLDVLELGTVNLGELLGDEDLTFPIILPEGVSNKTGVTEAKVSVRFPELGTKKLNITNIQAINVPVGMEADLITQVLEITIRGPKALVETIKESDVTVTVDFTDAPVGTATTMRAQVTIANGFSDVGVVGSYSVSASLHVQASSRPS